MQDSRDHSLTEFTAGMRVGPDGRYEIVRVCGRGGMGIVYEAVDHGLDRPRKVAVKQLDRRFAGDPRHIDNVRREVAIARELGHPHIVRVYDYVEWRDEHLVVMEWLDGGTLVDELCNKPEKRFSPEQALKIIKPIASALDYAHKQNPPVVHRDLKPLNIILTSSGTLKVMDFGLSREVKESVSRVTGKESSGSLEYMPFGQYMGEPPHPSHDIYALGITAYELLNGQPPFTRGDIGRQHERKIPPAIEGVPGPVMAVILKALAKDPGKRYATAGKFARAFESALQGKVPLPEKKSAPEVSKAPAVEQMKGKYKRPVKKKKLRTGVKIALGLASVLILAVVCLGGYFLYRTGKIEPGKTSGPGPVSTAPPEKLVSAYPKPGPGGGTGVFYLDSEPSGAKVFLDGKEAGTTPYMNDALPAGTYLIRLHKDYHQDLDWEITVQIDEVWKRTIPLDRGAGKCIVTTDIPEAQIFLDGKKKGTSPISVEAIAGSHVWRAIKGEKAQEVEKAIGTGETVRLSLTLNNVLFRDKVVTAAEKEKVLREEAGEKERKHRKLLASHLSAGKVHLERWEYDKAIASFIKVLELKPGHGEAKTLTARARKEKKEQERKEAIATNLSEGKRHLEKREYDRAIASFGKVLELEPGHGQAARLLDQAKLYRPWKNTIDMWFSHIPAGSFKMRSSGSVQPVMISRDYYMGIIEVTQGQWRKVMGTNPSNYGRCGDDCPVENVSWFDAVKFCNKLSEKEGLKPAYRISRETVTWDNSVDGYRLPTEAEWAYACRAGSKTHYSWGDEDPVCMPGRKNGARFDDNQKCDDIGPAPVKTYSSNAWGLYDMHGNVWEWCWDLYGEYSTASVTDPSGPSAGSGRVRRGGSCYVDAENCRSAVRGGNGPGNRYRDLGFRLLRPMSPWTLEPLAQKGRGKEPAARGRRPGPPSSGEGRHTRTQSKGVFIAEPLGLFVRRDTDSATRTKDEMSELPN